MEDRYFPRLVLSLELHPYILKVRAIIYHLILWLYFLGPYVFGTALSTYLISKEIYVLEHEFYSGLSLALVLIVGIKKLGPSVAQYLDKKIDEYENNWESSRDNQITNLQDMIKHEKK